MLFRLFRRTRDGEGVSVAAQYEQNLANQAKWHKARVCKSIIASMMIHNITMKDLAEAWQEEMMQQPLKEKQ